MLVFTVLTYLDADAAMVREKGAAGMAGKVATLSALVRSRWSHHHTIAVPAFRDRLTAHRAARRRFGVHSPTMSSQEYPIRIAARAARRQSILRRRGMVAGKDRYRSIRQCLRHNRGIQCRAHRSCKR